MMSKASMLLLVLLMASSTLVWGTTNMDAKGETKAAGMSVPEKAAPNQLVRPANFKPFEYPSAREIMEKHSEDMMRRADKLMKRAEKVNAAGKYKQNWESLDTHQTPEWFQDAKFGMFVDWGLFSIPAYAPSGYPDWYLHRMMWDTKAYHEKYWGKDFRQDDFIPLFKAEDFDAEYLADVAAEAGMKYIVPFLKHHDGFCLWDSSFTFRDSVDMGPKRDIAQEWVDACRKRNMKYGFYYSIDDWLYPVIEAGDNLTVREWHRPTDWMTDETSWDRRMMDGKVPVKDFYNQYINPAAIEFFDKYDPDIFWGDGDWVYDWNVRNSLSFLAYFYNKAEGRKEVVSYDRLGCCRLVPALGQSPSSGVHGDVLSTEAIYQPGKAASRGISLPWEECHGLSRSFGYNWRETDKDVRSAQDVLAMLVDIVADGGNLLLITNLTPTGKLDPLMAARLKEVGQWMKVNGQAIYATRRWVQYSQGNNIRFTQSKDSKYVYAFCYDWPDKELVLRDVKAEEGSSIQMLGASETLKWKQGESGLVIDIPESLSKNRPCDHIWVLKIPVSPSVAIGSTSTYFTKGSYSEVELESCGDIDEIRYTIDGSDPDRNSSMYTEPIKISSECTLIAQGFYEGKPNGDKATADFKLCVNVPAVKPQVYLEELDPVKINRGWSIGGKSWKKLSCTGGDLKISDKVYENGIGLHADAEVQFKIKPWRQKRFCEGSDICR
jgi:alpha-L-fucosidase